MIEPADDVKALSLLKSIDESSILTIEPAADFKAVSLSESIQEIIDSDGWGSWWFESRFFIRIHLKNHQLWWFSQLLILRPILY